MTATGDILSLARASQALALLGENSRVAQNSFKKKGKSKKFVKLGVKNIVGISLIRSQAQLSHGL